MIASADGGLRRRRERDSGASYVVLSSTRRNGPIDAPNVDSWENDGNADGSYKYRGMVSNLYDIKG